MPDYLLLMHNDARGDESAWELYLRGLRASGRLQGGSAIGDGVCLRKMGTPGPLAAHLSGFIRVAAATLEDAKSALSGNPVYEAGGTVEIRALPETD